MIVHKIDNTFYYIYYYITIPIQYTRIKMSGINTELYLVYDRYWGLDQHTLTAIVDDIETAKKLASPLQNAIIDKVIINTKTGDFEVVESYDSNGQYADHYDC